MVRITTLKQQKFSQSDPDLVRQFSKKLQSDPVLIRPKLASVLIRAHLCYPAGYPTGKPDSDHLCCGQAVLHSVLSLLGILSLDWNSWPFWGIF